MCPNERTTKAMIPGSAVRRHKTPANRHDAVVAWILRNRRPDVVQDALAHEATFEERVRFWRPPGVADGSVVVLIRAAVDSGGHLVMCW